MDWRSDMTNYLGIDIGTSSVKAVLLDERQRLIAEGSAALDVQRPAPRFSEQDPESWWQSALAAIADIRAAAPAAWLGLAGIGLSGQQHGATLLDAGGKVLRPCILWNDGRAAPQCAELLRRLPDFSARASNIPMPGFTAPKLLWVAEHEPEIFAQTRMVLLPKDYVRFRLSGDYVSEMSDSSGTLWLDIPARHWDDTLLAACDLSTRHMPGLVEGSEVSAYVSPDVAASLGLAGRRIPIAGGGGDNACSAVGIGAIGGGDGFLSLGTSGVVFGATNAPVALPERTLHGFCHALPGRWHGMAVVLTAASALGWIASIAGAGGDIAGLLRRVEAFAAVPGQAERAPVFLPYLTGERTPHNDPLATAQFAGLTIRHDAAALAYAVIEGVAFALADCLDVLVEANAAPLNCMLVGGGARSHFWAGLIADATGCAFGIPEGAELGAAFGAARLGMLAAGAGSEAEICAKPAIRHQIMPDQSGRPYLEARRTRMQALYSGGGKRRRI
jgi:xylulokinase